MVIKIQNFFKKHSYNSPVDIFVPLILSVAFLKVAVQSTNAIAFVFFLFVAFVLLLLSLVFISTNGLGNLLSRYKAFSISRGFKRKVAYINMSLNIYYRKDRVAIFFEELGNIDKRLKAGVTYRCVTHDRIIEELEKNESLTITRVSDVLEEKAIRSLKNPKKKTEKYKFYAFEITKR